MVLKRFRLKGLLLLLFLAVGQSGQAASMAKTRVLFIGNSYTYFNNLPHLLKMLAASAKPARELEIETVLQGGATLKALWESSKAPAAIRSGKWDFVVLQEQSTLGMTKFIDDVPQINDPKQFHDSVRLYDAEIKKAGAKTVLYMTWARQDSRDKQPLLTKAYTDIGLELNALVAPVGVAWQNALQAKPDLNFYQTDKSHPAAAGSYLAACVLYATLFNQNPMGLVARINGPQISTSNQVQGEGELIDLSEADARLLQQHAWQAVSKKR